MSGPQENSSRTVDVRKSGSIEVTGVYENGCWSRLRSQTHEWGRTDVLFPLLGGHDFSRGAQPDL